MRAWSDRKSRLPYALLALLFLLVAGSTRAGALEQLFAPKAELWPVWQQHDPESTQQIDHQLWDRFLQSNVVRGDDGIHRLSYADVTTADRQMLADYLQTMQAIRIHAYSRPQQLAYWINLYNALTVDVVLKHYPVRSIRDIDISPGLFADGPWGKKLLTIEGQTVSLNDIEHRILRPVWQDPRIHYAVNCASLGCPNLQVRAFTAGNTDDMLSTAAREFINHPRGVRVDGRDVFVSSIYSWFQKDFGQTEADVIRHLRTFADSTLSRQLEGIEFFAGDDYDWSLNDARPATEKYD